MNATALLLTTMLGVAACGAATAGKNQPPDSDRIVPPSAYLEDIETPGTTGGVEDEADAADAQAEEAEKQAEQRRRAQPQSE